MIKRYGDWMQTIGGTAFWPLDPQPAEIHITDVAHSLAMQCRFTGHVRRFYSVAEHSCHIADACPPEAALWGLLHDASEAYLTDVARPLKPYLSNYKQLEAGVMAAVQIRFGLAPVMPAVVKEFDNRILLDERRLMSTPPQPWAVEDLEPLGLTLPCWAPERARWEFLDRFYRLMHLESDTALLEWLILGNARCPA